MVIRFPLYSAVDEALVVTNALFGVDITTKKFPTAEDREIADNFDVKIALEEAIKQRNMMTQLPEADVRGPDGTGSYFDSYTPSTVLKYGKSCRKQALEDVVSLFEKTLYTSPQTECEEQYNDSILRQIEDVRKLV